MHFNLVLAVSIGAFLWPKTVKHRLSVLYRSLSVSNIGNNDNYTLTVH